MPFIVNDNFDDVLEAMKSGAKRDSMENGMSSLCVAANLNGHHVAVRVEKGVVREQITLIADWFIDHRQRGYNHVRGVLRGTSS